MKERPMPLAVSGPTRGEFLKFAAASVGSYVLQQGIDNRQNITTKTARLLGELGDELISPESIIPNPIPVLVPRDTDIPKVSRGAPQEPLAVVPTYWNKKDTLGLQLPSDILLQSNHSEVQVTDRNFNETGVAILTSAEGPIEGKQEYCMLFRGIEQKDQLVAVGYESGLYLYDHTLQEWVTVRNADDKKLTLTDSWEKLQSKKPDRMMIEDVARGVETLLDIGYRPWGAVLPSTKMPGAKKLASPLSHYATTKDSVLNFSAEGKGYFVTQNGDIIDCNHLKAKAGETFDLFTQLYTQSLNGESNPRASVHYSVGRDERYQFAVDPQSLAPETMLATVFQIMNEVTYRMEGISQRYLKENIAMLPLDLYRSGMSPEDMFTNSLGVTSMLSLLRKEGWLDKLKAPLLALDTQNAQLEAQLVLLKDVLTKQVMLNVVQTLGVRPLQEPPLGNLPLGISPLIPTKVTDEDGAHATHLDLTGFTPNNPNVRYSVTNVPTLELLFDAGAEKLFS